MDLNDPAAQELLRVNQQFYDAIESSDFDAMTAAWEHSDRTSCVHPGWPIIRGWTAIADSWRRIFDGGGFNQFILTNQSVSITGDFAWVVLDENLVANGNAGTVASTNIFARHDDRWLMIVHHGSPVATSAGLG